MRPLFTLLTVAVMLGSLAAVGAVPPPARAAADFTIAELPPLPGSRGGEPRGLNAAGQVVGVAYLQPGGPRAVLWQGGTVAALAALPGVGEGYAEANAINDRGQVVGVSGAAAGPPHAVLWQGGAIVDLGTPGGRSVARGINGAGEVVGLTHPPGQPERAVRWRDGAMAELDGLGGHSVAHAVNASGQVVGIASGPAGEHQAALWQDGAITVLGHGMAFALNDRGQAAGMTSMIGRAALWEGGAVALLGELPGGGFARANAINNRGEAVGEVATQAGGRAVLWRDGAPIDLTALLPPDSGWELRTARAINDAGQIAGTGALRGEPRAFLLTPTVPPPPPPPPAPPEACNTFPENRRALCGRFLDHWRANGGLAQQGLPLGPAFGEANPTDGRTYTTQYLERVRFERHPENQAPYDVLLGLLGREQFQARYPRGRPPSAPTGAPGEACFAETGYCVSGRFIEHWHANGGLAQQGYPISDEFEEVSPTDGLTYRVQYFERARFEHHPENAAPYDVLLGLLGREQFLARYPGGNPTRPQPPPPPPPPPDPYPFRDDFADPASGWPTSGVLEGATIGYAGGAYRIAIAKPGGAGVIVANRRLTPLADVVVEVDATRIAGPDAFPPSGAGIICRLQDYDNYYLFLVRSDGQATITKKKGDAWIPLAATGGAHAAIRRGNATNRLRAECVGDTLTLAVNGQRLLQAKDGDLRGGRVWLHAGTLDTPAAEYRFDNFIAARP